MRTILRLWRLRRLRRLQRLRRSRRHRPRLRPSHAGPTAALERLNPTLNLGQSHAFHVPELLLRALPWRWVTRLPLGAASSAVPDGPSRWRLIVPSRERRADWPPRTDLVDRCSENRIPQLKAPNVERGGDMLHPQQVACVSEDGKLLRHLYPLEEAPMQLSRHPEERCTE